MLQYDLDSVLRFEQFTVVDDKQSHRGPKAVQLRIYLDLAVGITIGPKAGNRKATDESVTEDVPKPRKKSIEDVEPKTIQPRDERNESITTISSADTQDIAEEPSSLEADIVCRIRRQPIAQEDLIESIDNRYLSFFLYTMPHVLPYTRLFPSIVNDVFSRSVVHRTLRHSVLSISSMIADYRLRRGMERFHYNYITSLRMIQNSIQNMDVDEATTIAVFLVLWIDVVRAELRSSTKHLRGLYLLLQEIQKKYRPPDMDGGMFIDQSGGVGVSPLIMSIWRLAIRLDWTTSLYLCSTPVFPTIPAEQQDFHRRWVILTNPDVTTAEWALATFAQDNLMHRACHLAARARATRLSPKYTAEMEWGISMAAAELHKENDGWYQRPIVQMAQVMEESMQFTHPDSPSEDPYIFSDYPSRHICNHFYANLYISSLAANIYISLITDPQIGPGTETNRFMDAVKICQTLSRLRDDKSQPESSKIWIIFLAGIAFGGYRSPRESKWLFWRVHQILKSFPLMKKSVDAYEKMWNVEGDFWDEMDKIQVLY